MPHAAPARHGVPRPARPPLRHPDSRHALADIPALAARAIIGGANTRERIAEHGRREESFPRRSLVPADGIPGHDTFYRAFARLRPAALLLVRRAPATGGVGTRRRTAARGDDGLPDVLQPIPTSPRA